MRVRRAILFAACGTIAAATLWAQSSTPQDLPSAPSAAAQEQQKKTQPPPPAPVPSPAQDKKAEDPAPSAPDSAPAATPDTTGAAPNQAPAPAEHPENNAADGTNAPGSPGPADIDPNIPTIVRRVNEVSVVFTVTDKKGHYVKGLTREDFRILDDARPAEEIRSFRSEANLPLQVGLLVDASNSIRDRFKFEQDSAITFLNQTIRPNYDKAFVVGFDVTPDVTQDFTDNTEKLSIGVRMLKPGGGHAMYDALYFACRDKLLKEPHGTAVRKAIILLSDGDDNQSHVSREEAIDMAQRAEVIVYVISTNIAGGGGKFDKILKHIADSTGGRAFFPFQLDDVADAFARIQEELRSQYAVAYKPSDFRSDGRYRTIAITAKDQKNLRVRSRPGYYAPLP